VPAAVFVTVMNQRNSIPVFMPKDGMSRPEFVM
jgi:hypothetical protein